MRRDAYRYGEFRRFVAIALWDLDVSVQSSLYFGSCCFSRSRASPSIFVYLCCLCSFVCLTFFGLNLYFGRCSLLLYYCSVHHLACFWYYLLLLLYTIITLSVRSMLGESCANGAFNSLAVLSYFCLSSITVINGKPLELKYIHFESVSAFERGQRGAGVDGMGV